MTASAVFPLGTSYLPGDQVMLTVFESRYLEMMSDVMEGSQSFASVLIDKGSEVGGSDIRHVHGVIVEVDTVVSHDSLILVTGTATAPCSISRWMPDNPYPQGIVELQSMEPLPQSQRYDIASSLTLLAQNIRVIHETLSQKASDFEQPLDSSSRIATIAAGRWWDQRIEENELIQAFWLLARNLPCGPFDRYSLLVPGSLTVRVKLLKQTVEHVQEVVSFRFDQ